MTKKQSLTIKEKLNEFLLYSDPQGEVRVEVLFHDENIWLSQKQMAELFNTTKQNVSLHLQNIFQEMDNATTLKGFIKVSMATYI